jgi:hypothetical protein
MLEDQDIASADDGGEFLPILDLAQGADPATNGMAASVERLVSPGDFNPDHHGIALVGGIPGPAAKRELHHVFAFEVALARSRKKN